MDETLGWAWARRSAPTTLAETGPRPSRGGGCRRDASRRRCCGFCGARTWSWSRASSGVTAAELSGWRDQFLAAGEASLKSRPADARDAEIDRLKDKVGELTMTTELLEAKIERLETHRPLARRRPR